MVSSVRVILLECGITSLTCGITSLTFALMPGGAFTFFLSEKSKQLKCKPNAIANLFDIAEAQPLMDKVKNALAARLRLPR